MAKPSVDNYESDVFPPATVIAKIRPGVSIVLGTVVAEPRAMVRYLTTSAVGNLEATQLFRRHAEELEVLNETSFRFFYVWNFVLCFVFFRLPDHAFAARNGRCPLQ